MKTLILGFWLLLCLALQGCFVPFKTVYKPAPDPLASQAVKVQEVQGARFTLTDGRSFLLAGVSLDDFGPEHRDRFEQEFRQAASRTAVLLLHDRGDGTARLIYADKHLLPPGYHPGWGIPIFPIIKPFYPVRIDLGYSLIHSGWSDVDTPALGLPETAAGQDLDGRELARRYDAARQWALEHHVGRFETDAERLVAAIAQRDRPAVERLLQHGADPNAPSMGYSWPTLPLHAALQIGDQEIARLLVSHGASVTDESGKPWPWSLATESTAQFILDLGVPLPVGEEASRLVINLARWNQLSALKRVLDAGLDCDGRIDGGPTALMFAARDGNLDAVQLLIARGADPGARDPEGKTALDYAANAPHVRAYLKSLGAVTGKAH